MAFKRRLTFTSTSENSRKRGKLSHKRLQTMINENQNSDSSLENYEHASSDSSDFRTQQDRSALLLWVHPLYPYKTPISLTHMSTGR